VGARLKEENSKLERAVADLTLDNQVLKELLAKEVVGPGAKRTAVSYTDQTRPDQRRPRRRNQSWAFDVMQDRLADGRTIPIRMATRVKCQLLVRFE
jgi:hypothetical protein